eukprot:11095306-Ditylum_brightwellii.AAC.1
MAYAIWEGLYHQGRAAIISFVKIQGIEQIPNFLCHIQTDIDIERMLEIAYAWAQYQTGWNTPNLDDVKTALPHFEARWLKSLRNYSKKINATIEVSKDPSYPI